METSIIGYRSHYIYLNTAACRSLDLLLQGKLHRTLVKREGSNSLRGIEGARAYERSRQAEFNLSEEQA